MNDEYSSPLSKGQKARLMAELRLELSVTVRNASVFWKAPGAQYFTSRRTWGRKVAYVRCVVRQM